MKCKFRAWDKAESVMVYSTDENHDYDFRCDENGALICYAKRDTDEPLDHWRKLDNIMLC